MIIADNLYYADPSTFNDPLDTRPSLNNDLPVSDLERAIRQLVEQRVIAEMKAAARTIKYKGPKTQDHIGRLSRLQADQVISEISYNANDPNYEMDDPHQFLLGRHLEKELLLQYEKGIVSLAQRATCRRDYTLTSAIPGPSSGVHFTSRCLHWLFGAVRRARRSP
jgi:hypothetical protein